jgi:hypothetical protein
MIEKKNYYWVPPLIGGILSLIALATPATYNSQMGLDFYVWMWGLASISIYDYYYGTYTDTTFTDNIGLLIPSIICSIIIFIGAVVLISSANMNRKSTRGLQRVKNTWYALSILLILTTAAWMIVYEVEAQVDIGMSWWETMDPGFGVIGVFIGASISLTGTVVFSYLVKQEGRELVPYKQLPTQKPQVVPTTVPKFCPMCGTKIGNDTFKFCTDCGFKLIQ